MRVLLIFAILGGTCIVKPVFKGHPYIREKVFPHALWPFDTGSLTWRRSDTIHARMAGCPLMGVSLEDRFYCEVCDFLHNL